MDTGGSTNWIGLAFGSAANLRFGQDNRYVVYV